MVSDDARGAVCATATSAAFAVNDALVKAVMHRAPIAQVLVVRGVIVSSLVALAVCWRGDWLRPSRAQAALMGARTFFDAVGSICFLTALAHMHQANASAIVQSLPLAVVAASAALGERVGLTGWLCVGIGMVGVLAIVRPGLAGFSRYSLFAAAAVTMMTARDLLTRRMPASIPSLVRADADARPSKPPSV